MTTDISEPQEQPSPQPIPAPPEIVEDSPQPFEQAAPVQEVTPEIPVAPVAMPPVAPPEPAPQALAEVDALRAQLARYEQEQAQASAMQQQMALSQQEATIVQQYEAQGIPQEYAQMLAQNWRSSETNRMQDRQYYEAERQFKTRQMAAAKHYSQQYGAPVDELLNFDTQTSMESHAKLWRRVAETENTVKRNAQSTVPAQSLDQGTSSAPPMENYETQLARLASKQTWSDADMNQYRKLTSGQ